MKKKTLLWGLPASLGLLLAFLPAFALFRGAQAGAGMAHHLAYGLVYGLHNLPSCLPFGLLCLALGLLFGGLMARKKLGFRLPELFLAALLSENILIGLTEDRRLQDLVALPGLNLPENILLWATSLETGEPMPNLTVELRGKDNKILWTGSTDMNGLALAPGWKSLDVPAADWGQPEIYAFVSSAGGDAVVSNLWNNGLEPWRFNLNYDYNPGAEQTRSMLFSDRGVYRPGETVY